MSEQQDITERLRDLYATDYKPDSAPSLSDPHAPEIAAALIESLRAEVAALREALAHGRPNS